MKCVDLFSGCGGLSLGFEKAGFEVAAAFEYWDPSIEVYKQNFSHPVFKQDLTNEKESIKKIKEFSPDLIMGGPPCQDFSSAGKRDVTQGRADLTYHFANIICSIKPKWFVMENVEQIKKSHILKDVIKENKLRFRALKEDFISRILNSEAGIRIRGKKKGFVLFLFYFCIKEF